MAPLFFREILFLHNYTDSTGEIKEECTFLCAGYKKVTIKRLGEYDVGSKKRNFR